MSSRLRPLSFFFAGVVTMPLLACSAGDEDSSALLASNFDTDSSPFDERVWDYELPLLDDHERLGCDYQFIVSHNGLFAGQHFTADWVYAHDRVLTGQMRSRKPWPEKYGVGELEVIQRCNDGSGEYSRPDTIGYRGISSIDLSTLVSLSTAPGSKSGLPTLNSPNPFYGAAGKSITFIYRGVEKAPPLDQDVNCAGKDPATTDRFYVDTWVDTLDVGRAFTVSIDDGRYVTTSPMRGWFTYCRPKGEGPANQIKVQIDAVDHRILKDRVFESTPVTVTAGQGRVEIEHRYKGERQFLSAVTMIQ